MAGQRITIQKDALLKFAVGVFAGAGVAPKDAELWADILVWANLRGVDSHGVLRIPDYLDHIDTGRLNPRPEMSIERSEGAAVRIDADLAPGPVAWRSTKRRV